MKLNLKIINLDGVYLLKEVDSLTVKTVNGQLTILANHLPLISKIEISQLYLKEDGVINRYAIAGGTLFVSEEETKIITTAIESESEIDFKRAEEAYKRAEEIIKVKEGYDLRRAEVSLKKALNRLSLKDK